jgi:hypothetical protein
MSNKKSEKKKAKIIHKIALLLLSAEPDSFNPDETFNIYANEAADMAHRASKGWWTLGGRPYFNEWMADLKVALERKAHHAR